MDPYKEALFWYFYAIVGLGLLLPLAEWSNGIVSLFGAILWPVLIPALFFRKFFVWLLKHL